MDIIAEKLTEMRRQFPSFRIIKEDKAFFHTADVFLYRRNYGKFEVEVYAMMMPACSLGADIYENNKFQNSISTWSGEWKENLNMLEKALEEMAKGGLDATKSQFDGDRLGISKEKFLL